MEEAVGVMEKYIVMQLALKYKTKQSQYFNSLIKR
jgi:hypothetical protein